MINDQQAKQSSNDSNILS